jgi:hypothetical protein
MYEGSVRANPNGHRRAVILIVIAVGLSVGSLSLNYQRGNVN